MKLADTIAAQATAVGQGGVGIIRVSGALVPEILQQMVGKLPSPRSAHFSAFKSPSGAILDEGLVIYFPGPNSFTGEDVAEFQGHGGQIVLNSVLQCIIGHGARLARPGEFSERAFLNNKLDLAQAEAVADLIAANSEQAARAAMRSLQGEFSAAVHGIVNHLIALRTYVEAAMDFPDEEIDFLTDERVADQLSTLHQQLLKLKAQAGQGLMLRDGIRLAIAGVPNVGKSSLLNRLTGEDTAIVTPIEGTTRDVLKADITIEGVAFQIVDTAGIRATEDCVEQEGIKRAQQEIQRADVMILVVDHNKSQDLEQPFADLIHDFATRKRLVIVRNKIDLTNIEPKTLLQDDARSVLISAKTGAGIAELKQALLQTIGYNGNAEGTFTARSRHIRALDKALQHLNTGIQQLNEFQAADLLAEELRLTQNALNEITGEFRADDLLGKIFSTFCIGK